MKTFSETSVLLLALAIACCLGVAVAVEPKEFPTYEHLTFLNFHREPIDVYSFDKESNTQELLLSVPPYEETTIQTYSGSHYSYKWGKEQYLSTTVKETSFLRVNESDYDRDLKSQVHVMGLVNIPDGPMIQLVTGNKLRRKPQRVYVKCGTTKGDFDVIVNPEWSPRGAAHYLKLVKDGHFTNMAIHNRTEAGIEYGISADYNKRSDFPEYILDDPMFVPPILHKPGTMSFSADTENGRSDMIFTIMQGDYCDSMVHGLRNNTWETPFAYVDSRDLKVLDQITWWVSNLYLGRQMIIFMGLLESKTGFGIMVRFPFVSYEKTHGLVSVVLCPKLFLSCVVIARLRRRTGSTRRGKNPRERRIPIPRRKFSGYGLHYWMCLGSSGNF